MSLTQGSSLAPSLPAPSYSPSASVPRYSLKPRSSETTLAASPRKDERWTGIFTTSNKNGIILELFAQDPAVPIPVYGRSCSIEGAVLLDCTQDVQSVSLKLEGTLDVAVGGGSNNSAKFFCKTDTVWKATSASVVPCPSVCDFNLGRLINTESGRVGSLPPTFNTALPGKPSGPMLHGRNSARLSTQLVYHPRSRPLRSILPCPFPFLSTVKSLPDEWHQVITTIPSMPGSTAVPINCLLFIPEAQIYCISASIPFYLQLCAPVESLRAFMYPTPPPTSKLRRAKSFDPSAKPSVLVSIVRQVIAIVGGAREQRSTVLGEGKLCPLPPGASTPLHSPPDGSETLNWEGTVRCRKDVRCGGFSVGNLVVKDFIALNLEPAYPKTSPLRSLEHLHAVRLVTDSTDS
ncbi:hypothetical protein EW146_g778 [Bondarzewia mesenterica]|uniref:Uncharacterized protein n=1 Tax=Bondarzewia mesenterica TaxID=1095465 RepID=A0A4S4M6C8_9AGAM|nr:hypothetical protein EW146_g778 [Bondarzewia mesenterica]